MQEHEQSIWPRALEYIKAELNNDQTYNVWFSPIKYVGLAQDKITLEVPNKFFSMASSGIWT